ncbi:hypothetical protein [Ulvibacter litoralis]|uniref:SGNH/GDSL hydrolase family protein n=1 Tax=Ulvibacter litoralis TaxID=227084 RepID=A0A1G7GZH3_9FLAO|nr:hypothetical protein [Ulvibacter litoralis]GHC59505.1 hypothetical protein GCM10008083_25480 [Ulvibacter litoralis]SDE93558.1 hypothetical protein SAMN05421855_103422 [Ulvibacter litoralis]
MKQFLTYLFSLVALTLALLYCCDFLYTQVYINATPRNKLQYIIETENENFDVVFLGSSRVANHIDTELFENLSNKKTINLGVEGAGLNDNLLQLKLLIAKNTVKTIYLQIDTNFESENPSNIVISEAMPFISNPIVKNHVKKYFNNFNKLTYIPFYRYAINDPKIGFREFFLSLINKKPRIAPSNGFAPKFGNRTPLRGHNLPITIKQENSVLNEFIEICKKNEIQLLLYTSPYCSSTNNLNYFEKLTLKIPGLINYSKGFNDTLFFNCGHLNNKGAQEFTNLLYITTKNKLISDAKK